MWKGKNAEARFFAYDRCLQNLGRKYSWTDLLEEANKELENQGLDGIGKTQFYKDIEYLKSSHYNAPIVNFKEGRTSYFKYSDPSYSLRQMPLGESEINKLKSAIEVMTRLNGAPQSDWLNEIIPILETKLGLIKTEKEIISLDGNLDYVGRDKIAPLFNAIINKRVLKVKYQDFKSPVPYDLIFHPYYLKQYNSRWFCFGYNADTKNYYHNLALDRITEDLVETELKYHSSDIDWDDYFFDLIGVTKEKGKKLVEVKLLFTDEQAPYVITKPLHPTQKSRKDENGLTVTLKVIPNYELEKLILSFGENVKILSPEFLKDRIKTRIINMKKLY